MSQTVILVIGLILSVAGMLGVAYAVFRSATVSQTIDLLEAENTAQRNSLERQRTDLNLLQERVSQLEQAKKVLQDVVTGRSEIEALANSVAAEEAKRREEHQTMLTLLKDLIAQFRQARGEIGR